MLFFTELGCQPDVQPSTWRTRTSLFIWNLILDLPLLGGPASSYATAGTAFKYIGLHQCLVLLPFLLRLLKSTCQFTPLLNLRPLVCGLMHFG